MMAAALLAVDPCGLGGAVLRGPPGPARDGWLDELRSLLPPAAPFRRVPLAIGEDRLLGGLDLAATLSAGRPLEQRGVLAEAHGGVVLLASAERIGSAVAARIVAVLDRGEIIAEREGLTLRSPAEIGVIALDEAAGPDESVPAALLDRLAFLLDPRAATDDQLEAGDVLAGDVAAARLLLAEVDVSEEVVAALCQAALSLGVASLRAPLLALRAARAAAALAGRTVVEAEDAALGAELVLAPRATKVPYIDNEAEPEPPPAEPPEQEPEDRDDRAGTGQVDDLVLQAALAALPPGLLAQLAAGESRAATAAGKSGVAGRSGARGRPAGIRAGDPRQGKRLALLDTMRAAVPFQRLRGGGERFRIQAGDLRVVHRKPRSSTTTIFVVDASGSQALGRLAEAKGAVQQLLAECYVRRDEVALIAFRGRGAEVLLPPTRSLVRAKRSLAGLPGGGGTPLASGLELGCTLADSVKRRGGTPALVVLTDGAANVGRDGQGGRAAAERDAQAAAKRLKLAAHRAILVDSSFRPAPASRKLAIEMGARYVALPLAGAATISGLVRE